MTYLLGDELKVGNKTFVYTHTEGEGCEGCDLAVETHGGCPDCAIHCIWKEKKDELQTH